MQFRDAFGRAWTLEIAVAAAVFGLVVLAMTYGIVRYRASRRATSSQNTEHPRVEAAYAAAILAVALSIYGYTYHVNAQETAFRTPTVTVEVTGFQWCWQFHYVTPQPRNVTGDCLHGRYPTLVVPTGENVAFVLRSDDVIHSFWIPHFRYKLDVFPTHTNQFVMSIPRPGVWEGHCAQFCGIGHTSMLFHIEAVPPQRFQSWLRSPSTAVSP